MRHIVAMLSSCDWLNDDLDVSTFLAYKRKLGWKAKIEPFSRSPNLGLPLNIGLLGGDSVGKSYIFDRVSGKVPDFHQKATVGYNCFSLSTRLRDRTDAQLTFWDTPGYDSCYFITPRYLRKCVCAVLVFSVVDRQSFNNLHLGIQIVGESMFSEAKFILVGTQIDRESRRIVSIEEGYAFAKQTGALSYLEVSGKTGENVHEIVDLIEAFHLPPKDSPLKDLPSVSLIYRTPISSSTRCF
jgi:small GTP-binding protein